MGRWPYTYTRLVVCCCAPPAVSSAKKPHDFRVALSACRDRQIYALFFLSLSLSFPPVFFFIFSLCFSPLGNFCMFGIYAREGGSGRIGDTGRIL